MKKLKTKILIFILVPVIFFFGSLSVYVSSQVRNIVEANAVHMLYADGESLASGIALDLEKALRSVQMLSGSIQASMENELTPSRESANIMLQQLLSHSTDYSGVWMYWDANAFDGKDQLYINQMGGDATGRYMPFWSRSAEGYKLGRFDYTGQVQERLLEAFQTGKDIIFEPYWYDVEGEAMLFTSVVSPIVINGKTVGVSGINLMINQLSEGIEQKNYYKTGKGGLVSNKGTVLSFPDQELIGKNYYEEELEIETQRDSARLAVSTGSIEHIIDYSSYMEKDIYQVFTPVKISNVAAPWSAVLMVPVDEVMEVANGLIDTVINGCLFTILILIIIIVIISRAVTKPIVEAVKYGQNIAAGDFTIEVDKRAYRRQDEIGDLARSFAAITANLKSLIGGVQSTSIEVLQSAHKMNEGAQQSSIAANEIATSMEKVARSAENQMQGAEETARTMEEMANGVQTVATASSTLSSAAQEMSVRANAGQQMVTDAVIQMNRIQNETQTSKKMITLLQAETSKIEDIVTVIANISSQTNLLALNAAIEAARAGEAGRGFAVVANEVRKLAEQTSNSTTDIQELLLLIITSATKANESMNVNGAEVGQGVEKIEQVGQAFNAILASVQEVSNEIIQLSAVAEQMSAASEQISATSEETAAVAEVATGYTQQVAAASEEQMATMEEMKGMARSLKELAGDLNDQLKKFKV